MSDMDLSPEQQITRAIVARVYGPAVADRVVRDDRFAAYAIGAHLAPVLERLAASAAEVIRAVPRRFGDTP